MSVIVPEPAPERPDLSQGEPDDLFVIAYDEYIIALDRNEALGEECRRVAASMPRDMQRNPRALLGLTTESGKSVPVYAASHDEIDQATDAMMAACTGDPVSELPIIEAFDRAAHAALDADEQQLREARVVYGLDEALERHLASFDDIRAARERMLAIVPISPEGIVWLSQFVHAAANDEQDLEMTAKAARNLALATSRKVFGRDLLPTLH